MLYNRVLYRKDCTGYFELENGVQDNVVHDYVSMESVVPAKYRTEQSYIGDAMLYREMLYNEGLCRKLLYIKMGWMYGWMEGWVDGY